MQKLISLFAEALEIMNIKAKLNVFSCLTETKSRMSRAENRFGRLFNRRRVTAKKFPATLKSRCANEIMCHLSLLVHQHVTLSGV